MRCLIHRRLDLVRNGSVGRERARDPSWPYALSAAHRSPFPSLHRDPAVPVISYRAAKLTVPERKSCDSTPCGLYLAHRSVPSASASSQHGTAGNQNVFSVLSERSGVNAVRGNLKSMIIKYRVFAATASRLVLADKRGCERVRVFTSFV